MGEPLFGTRQAVRRQGATAGRVRDRRRTGVFSTPKWETQRDTDSERAVLWVFCQLGLRSYSSALPAHYVTRRTNLSASGRQPVGTAACSQRGRCGSRASTFSSGITAHSPPPLAWRTGNTDESGSDVPARDRKVLGVYYMRISMRRAHLSGGATMGPAISRLANAEAKFPISDHAGACPRLE
ncbi:hypothetical protein DAEQUDRAFT_739987 [Daedalea quercina L-15889]|uniref:Uncharacterized protein n=1 Tax=Daedalea quercina L-15889 TaxID=1314783 RepID=A0A165N2B8_9APHY|nr:hypothetical protein DAEQUDRAFT_739987 [Daedalea quercina L-15889]